MTLRVGVLPAKNSGAVTRISGDPSWNRDLENTWDWPAINAPIDLTWQTVNAMVGKP